MKGLPIRRPLRFATVLVLLVATASTARAQEQGAGDSIRWQDAPALGQPRDHHAVFEVRAGDRTWIHVAGGTDYRGMFDDVSRAAVADDGSLGPWESVRPLPTPRAGASALATADVVVLAGGQVTTGEGLRGLRRIDEVYTARVLPGGELGPWRPGPTLPRPRFHHPLVRHGEWLYVVGGQGEREAEAGVFAARLGPDGSLSDWIEATPLPRPRSHHAALVIGQHLYVFGGLDGRAGGHEAGFVDVLRAEIGSDGTLGEWRRASTIPHAYATQSVVLHGGHVWMFGGVEDLQRFSADVWRAALNADGSIGPWTEVPTPLPHARGHVHVTPLVDGRVYSAGGRVVGTGTGPEVTGAVHVGELPGPARTD
mgnify:CR=1 FL=1